MEPASGFTRMPFASTSLGAEQPLLNSDLLGYGRDPLAPIKDAVTADGDVVVPLDAEAFGFWLKAAFGTRRRSARWLSTATSSSRGCGRCPACRSRPACPRCRATRGQETELPQALKWQVARADEDYDAALVEARRFTVDTTRIASESFPVAVPPEEAERRCRRALMEAWVGRETAAFRLPPSQLALDPADAIRLEHDGRLVDLRLVSIADAEARGIEAVRQDRATYDLPPGDPRAASLPGLPAAADRGPARASAAGRRARGSLAR
ncbi:phage tail tube protein [Aurantimonas sp. A2-1-M11]|uniref:phage tail tube protein n=1 Tax=Aurantimonas sp. A2-1-M11 TaxID=3113712 RepID=UPI002F9383B9